MVQIQWLSLSSSAAAERDHVDLEHMKRGCSDGELAEAAPPRMRGIVRPIGTSKRRVLQETATAR